MLVLMGELLREPPPCAWRSQPGMPIDSKGTASRVKQCECEGQISSATASSSRSSSGASITGSGGSGSRSRSPGTILAAMPPELPRLFAWRVRPRTPWRRWQLLR